MKNVIDFSAKKATDWKRNKRIIVPEISDEKVAIKNNFVKVELLKVAEDYMKKTCVNSNVKHGRKSEITNAAVKSSKQDNCNKETYVKGNVKPYVVSETTNATFKIVKQENHMKENDMKCKVDHSNKSYTTNAAIKSLKQKQKNGIIVYETDKTSKFVVDTLENFEHKMQPHIQKDPIVE